MQKAKILSIDDDPSVTRALQQVLEAQNYQVQTINHPENAKALVKQNETLPELILLDIHMPEMDGYQLCEFFQQDANWSQIPVIYLTAQASEENRQKAFKLGAVGFLSKPLKRQTLLKNVAKYIKIGQQWKQKAKSGLPQKQPKKPIRLSKKEPLKLQKFIDFAAHYFSLERSHLPPGTQLYPYFESKGVSAQALAQSIAKHCKFQYLPNLSNIEYYLGILPLPFCRTYLVLPIHQANGELAFVMANPFQLELQDMLKLQPDAPWLISEPREIMHATRLAEQPEVPEAQPEVSPSESMNSMHSIMEEFQSDFIDKYGHEAMVTELEDTVDSEAPSVIRMVNQIIENAHLMEASDIHIEPWEDGVALRYRIDGKLQLVGKLTPLSVIAPIAARIKIMSQLDISERRLPQDGRIQFQKFSRKAIDIDLRVSTAPMNYGEKIVMRILDKQKSTLPLDVLGFSENQLQLYREQIANPYGMILHVGPTGSGKSMTLYAAIHDMKSMDINIQTAEDPIEYTLYGINQMQVKPEIGLTFAKALRSYMRQDPDVILVGEIRDQETALTAIEASLTGHLLLSTLHTNDAPSTLIRFVEMGIEPFMISSSILLICAQRLVRRLCPHCKIPDTANTEEKAWLKYSNQETFSLFRASGCAKCNHTGYKGRTGVYELLIPNDTVRQALNEKGMTAERLKDIAMKEGMQTLFQVGISKVSEGITSTEEILAHIRQDQGIAPPWPLLNEGKTHP